jgi:hypothetical protein
MALGAEATQMPKPLTQANLKTPKAAGIAGILFSVLLIAVFWLLRTSMPADPQEPGSWLQSRSAFVTLALNLMPFAGIAFLWFIGVLRDRLGQQEDRFFATVFFGSGLLFLAMLFTAAAIVGALLIAFAMQPQELIGSATFHFARAAAYSLVNVYMIKMASVFMITTSTVAILHRNCPALVSCPRLCAGTHPAIRELLHELELSRLPVMGVSSQCFHSKGRHPATFRSCRKER